MFLNSEVTKVSSDSTNSQMHQNNIHDKANSTHLFLLAKQTFYKVLKPV